MFNINQLSRIFASTQALKNLNFSMDKGLHIIVGPSGSEKSTLLRILSGMDKDYEGSVQFAGQELKDIKDLSIFYNQVFGFVWQEAYLVESMTVLDQVLLPQYLK